MYKSKLEFETVDITTIKCDCIVNAANRTLLGGGGVDGAIHRAAGPELLQECRTLNGCKTGQAKITNGYDLPAKYVIHTVGPVYSGSDSDVLNLTSCYRNSLDLAKNRNLHSIAFSAISTGVYGYPFDEAAMITLETTAQWLVNSPDYQMDILLTCFDDRVYKSYVNYLKNYTGNNEYLKKIS
ncbi:O-acetyl-ADP-ribose deacetylase [Companilactobacillus keshanensis]|uniref:O-acetyl-ADP-ribose deacetylase n=1 Tax=Companilactobacillus keshanensis TaxID=2486003 RepID=A0ABW4BSJ8_9LACO|nr:O-acetyl-ADP-ribose deacetylase [Companilactobacillus keshanensis]